MTQEVNTLSKEPNTVSKEPYQKNRMTKETYTNDKRDPKT